MCVFFGLKVCSLPENLEIILHYGTDNIKLTRRSFLALFCWSIRSFAIEAGFETEVLTFIRDIQSFIVCSGQNTIQGEKELKKK